MTAETGSTLATRRRSPLAGLAGRMAGVGRAGVVELCEVPFLAQVSLRVAGDEDGVEVRRACGRVLGVELPVKAGEAAGDARRSVLWLGPDEWLVVGGAGEDGSGLARMLGEAVDGAHASVVDVSANRTVLELSGPMARDVLASGCRLDLHQRAFGPGTCASTDFARTQVILHQLDDTPTYRLFVRGSFAAYLADWLLDAMLEHTSR